MASVLLSSISGADSAALPQLAPDLTMFTDRGSLTRTFTQVTGIDPSSGPVTALSLTGAYAVPYIALTGFIAESITVKLTIDGEIKVNDTFTASTSKMPLWGGLYNDNNVTSESYGCKTTFLLELTTATDTSVTLEYIARPIL